MKIRDLMIEECLTITERASIQEALEVMKVNSIRHLPVVSENNHLVGFLTLADLRAGLMPSMISQVSLADLIIRDPITVHPDDDIEVAAQLIYNHKIGGLPVVEHGRVVGILTESDILRAFIDMMGILTSTSRVEVVMDNSTESLNNALRIISECGGDIINVGTSGQQTAKKTYWFRLSSCKTDGIRTALENEGFTVSAAMD
jgi:acetoin utilization protein AcuB